ncbi:MAG: hypothetical protein ACK5OC_24375 [Pirellula sp.]
MIEHPLVAFFPGLAITEGRIPQNVTKGTHLQIVPSKEIGLGLVNDETFLFGRHFNWGKPHEVPGKRLSSPQNRVKLTNSLILAFALLILGVFDEDSVSTRFYVG